MDVTREQLVAALEHLSEDSMDFDPSESDGRYFDWSVTRDGERLLEVGADGEAVQMSLTPQEFEHLVMRLVATLLRNR
jgi:hypothetical protein